MIDFTKEWIMQEAIIESCSAKEIEWKCIPQRSPHFGKATVKSLKGPLKHVVGDVKLTKKYGYWKLSEHLFSRYAETQMMILKSYKCYHLGIS